MLRLGKMEKARFCAHLPGFLSEKHLRTDEINMYLRFTKEGEKKGIVNKKRYFHGAKNSVPKELPPTSWTLPAVVFVQPTRDSRPAELS